MSLFLAGCGQTGSGGTALPGPATATPIATSAPTQTPVIIVVTATPTATLFPVLPGHTSIPVIIVATATPTSTATTSPTPTEAPSILEHFTHMARRDLARRFNVSPEAIALETAGPVSWPYASLGCPTPGYTYAQVITPGYLIRLLHQGRTYQYHSDALGPPFLCEHLSAPLPTGTPTPAPTVSPTPSATPIAMSTPVALPTLTPTLTPTATAIPTPTATVTYTPTATPIAPIAVPQVVIQNVDLQGEMVTIVNLGSAPQDMIGWTLTSEEGSQVFRFPNGFVLAPGATVRVTSGSSSYSDPPAVLQWLNADGTPRKSNVWNDQGDPAILKDAEGSVVSTFL